MSNDSEPKYQDPTVAYNTGYNDGQREEREVWLKELADFEIATLAGVEPLGEHPIPEMMGRLKQLTRKLSAR
jgi:hypothetical protein